MTTGSFVTSATRLGLSLIAPIGLIAVELVPARAQEGYGGFWDEPDVLLVTPEGDIVWEYVNGFMGLMRWGRERKQKRLETGVYRCYRVSYDAVPDFSQDFAYNYDGETTLLRHPGLA